MVVSSVSVVGNALRLRRFSAQRVPVPAAVTPSAAGRASSALQTH